MDKDYDVTMNSSEIMGGSLLTTRPILGKTVKINVDLPVRHCMSYLLRMFGNAEVIDLEYNKDNQNEAAKDKTFLKENEHIFADLLHNKALIISFNSPPKKIDKTAKEKKETSDNSGEEISEIIE
jgi:hypothetical protein